MSLLMRRLRGLVLGLLLVGGMQGFSAASAVAALPPQGMYMESSPADPATTGFELGMLGHAGFKLALNYEAWYGDAAQIQAFAAQAQSLGVKLIWPLNAPAWLGAGSLRATYPALAADSGASSDGAFLQYAINLVSKLPATWGYYIGDETDPSQLAAVRALSTQVRELDPTRPQLFIAQGFTNLQANLSPFAPSADVVGADAYPIGNYIPTSAVGQVARRVRRVANQANDRTAMVLQAFSWGQYPQELQAPDPRWPTQREMQAMRDQAASIKPSMILWYNLSDVLRSDNPAQHWHDLVSAAFAPYSSGRSALAEAAVDQDQGHHRHHRHHKHHRHHRHHRIRQNRSH